MEKIIKISAVFKIKDEANNENLVEIAMTYDAQKASEEKSTKLDIYNALKKSVEIQMGEGMQVLDASLEEVSEHYEQK